MLVKKIISCLGVIALLASAPAVVYAGDVDTVMKKKQIFKTGKGMAAGQSSSATGAGGAGGIGGVAAGTVVAGVAVAAAVAAALSAYEQEEKSLEAKTRAMQQQLLQSYWIIMKME